MPTPQEAAVWLASLIGKAPEHLTAHDWMHVICRANRLSEQGSMAFHLAAALSSYGAACAAEEKERCAGLDCLLCRRGVAIEASDEGYGHILSGRWHECKATRIWEGN